MRNFGARLHRNQKDLRKKEKTLNFRVFLGKIRATWGAYLRICRALNKKPNRFGN